MNGGVGEEHECVFEFAAGCSHQLESRGGDDGHLFLMVEDAPCGNSLDVHKVDYLPGSVSYKDVAQIDGALGGDDGRFFELAVPDVHCVEGLGYGNGEEGCAFGACVCIVGLDEKLLLRAYRSVGFDNLFALGAKVNDIDPEAIGQIADDGGIVHVGVVGVAAEIVGAASGDDVVLEQASDYGLDEDWDSARLARLVDEVADVVAETCLWGVGAFAIGVGASFVVVGELDEDVVAWGYLVADLVPVAISVEREAAA